MNSFLRAVELRRLAEHEAQLSTTPLEALPCGTPESLGKRAAIRLVRAEDRERREALRARARRLRAADWTWAEIAEDLGLTVSQVGAVAMALLREERRSTNQGASR